MKKVIVSPDSFKGSLSAIEAADAMKEGVRRVFPQTEIIKLPIADGGEGTMDTLVHAVNGKHVNVRVHDPLMRLIDAEYGLVNDGETAVIEMAKASGLTLLTEDERNPVITTTFGTGEMIKDAIRRGCRSFLIAIGGSATNDAGTGMLKALGFRFLDKNGTETDGTGQSLSAIHSIDTSTVLPELRQASFQIACDVNNPFSGEDGAAYIYATQKGADKEMITLLDEGLENFRQLINREKNIDLNSIAGAGAAGGLGGGLVAFLDAKLEVGIDMILDAVNYEEHLQYADLIFTGEGQIDKQSIMGKALSGILAAASKKEVPVIALGGSVEDIEVLNNEGFLSVLSITPAPISLQEALSKKNAYRNLVHTTEQIMRIIKKYE